MFFQCEYHIRHDKKHKSKAAASVFSLASLESKVHGHLVFFGHFLACSQAFDTFCAAEEKLACLGHEIFSLKASCQSWVNALGQKHRVHSGMHFPCYVEQFSIFFSASLTELHIQNE